MADARVTARPGLRLDPVFLELAPERGAALRARIALRSIMFSSSRTFPGPRVAAEPPQRVG